MALAPPVSEEDISGLITATDLIVTCAQDALDVLWLVESGKLPAMRRPLKEEEGQYLGHGGVLVWLDNEEHPPNYVVRDGRSWWPPNKMDGTYDNRDYRETSSLHRRYLNARLNVKTPTKTKFWHLVAYQDRNPAMSLPPFFRPRDHPQLRKTAMRVPTGYFIPTWGRLSMVQVEPHDRIDREQRTYRPPPERLASVVPPVVLVSNEVVTKKEFTEIIEVPPDPNRFKEVGTDASIPVSSPAPPKPRPSPNSTPNFDHPPPAPPITQLTSIPITHFLRALMPSPNFSALIKRTASALIERSKPDANPNRDSGIISYRDGYTRYTHLPLAADYEGAGGEEVEAAFGRLVDRIGEEGERISNRKGKSGLTRKVRAALCPTASDADNEPGARKLVGALFSLFGPTTAEEENEDEDSDADEGEKEQKIEKWEEASSIFHTRLGRPRERQAAEAEVEEIARAKKAGEPVPELAGWNRPLLQIPHPPPPPDVSFINSLVPTLLYHRHPEANANSIIRTHVIALDVVDEFVYVCYADRSGTLISTPLSLTDDFQTFVELILALTCGGGETRGYLDLAGGSTAEANRLLLRDRVFRMTGRTMDHSQAPVTLMGGGRVSTFVEVELDSISKKGWLEFFWVPSTPSADADADAEEGTLQKAKQAGVSGVPVLSFAARLVRLYSLLRGSLCAPGEYMDRELRVRLLEPAVRPLWTVTDERVFQSAFRSLVVAHEELFTRAKIVDRRITLGDLMVQSSQPSKGILYHLSEARSGPSLVPEYGRDGPTTDSDDSPNSPSSSWPPTTSPAFVPISSLERASTISIASPQPESSSPATSPESEIAEWLESLIYILAWLLYGYSSGEALPRDDNPLAEWGENSQYADEEKAMEKRAWVRAVAGGTSAVGKRKATQFEETRKRWLVPLVELLAEQYGESAPRAKAKGTGAGKKKGRGEPERTRISHETVLGVLDS